MFNFFSKNKNKSKLTPEEVEGLKNAVISAAEGGDDALAWREITALLDAQAGQDIAAFAVIDIVRDGHMSVDKSYDLLEKVYTANTENDLIIGVIGTTIESARDLNNLNAPPPTGDLFETLIARLTTLAATYKDTETESLYVEGLASSCRMVARQYDELAEDTYRRLIELLPGAAWVYYCQGLYFKTRGKFAEGAAANAKAMSLVEEPNDALQWNLGICATGAGDSAAALKVWKLQGQKIEHGRFDLPEGGYPSCKVKLAERPLAERGKDNDDPGLEESIWIERLSPCHGIIRSVLYADLGVDYGDVVLFDGAPITTHTYGERQVSVFPHLATLRKRNYQFYDFAGTQNRNGRLSDVSDALDEDAVVYSHTEQMKIICSGCWNNEDLQHAHQKDDEKHVIFGRIAAPPDMRADRLLAQIDKALEGEPENRIFSPQLCNAAGFHDRSKIEGRRYDMLTAG